MNSMNCESWKQAINSELDSLKKLGVYVLVDKPKYFPLLKGKWIFVTNRLPDGSSSNTKPDTSRKAIYKFKVKITLKLFHPL